MGWLVFPTQKIMNNYDNIIYLYSWDSISPTLQFIKTNQKVKIAWTGNTMSFEPQVADKFCL